MRFKEYDKVRTKVYKEGYPSGTMGVIVSFYPHSNLCEVELWDKDSYPIDVITFNFAELEKVPE